jgi:CheY-like chemotaxis protein
MDALDAMDDSTPRTTDGSNCATAAASAHPTGAGMARILIVDDEPRNRRLLEVIVGSDGHVPLHASNGSEALALAASESPDLILLDLMMPEMDGFQLVRQLRQNAATRTTPIIVVSALDEPAARQRVLASGADDFLAKPLDRWELLLREQAPARAQRERGSARPGSGPGRIRWLRAAARTAANGSTAPRR